MRRIWLLVVVAAVLFLPALQPVAVCSTECSEPAALPTTGQIEPIRNAISGVLTGLLLRMWPLIARYTGGRGLLDVLGPTMLSLFDMPLVGSMMDMLPTIGPIFGMLGTLCSICCIPFGFCDLIPCIGPIISGLNQTLG